jgi:hypothetical protein
MSKIAKSIGPGDAACGCLSLFGTFVATKIQKEWH